MILRTGCKSRELTGSVGVMLAIALGLALGCGGDETPQQQGPRLTADGKKIIRFWQFWTDPVVKPVIERAVAEFETTHPEYKVELTDLTWNDGHQKIVTAFAAGDVPDLLELGSDWIAEFAATGALHDLTSEGNQMRGEFAAWPPAFWQGRCYALPWYVATRVIFQNDRLAAMVGVTEGTQPAVWPRFLDVVTSLGMYRNQGIYGFGCNAAEKHRLYKKFLPFFWSNGGRIISPDGTYCMLNSPAGVGALEFYTSLCEGGIVEKQSILDDMFVEGQIGWVMSGDWLYKKLRAADVRFDYSVLLMPQPGPDSGASVSFAGGEYLTVPKASRNVAGAIELARHMLQAKHIVNLNIATGCATPVRRSALDNAYFHDDPVRVRFLQQFNTSQSPPPHPKWVEIEALIEEAVESAMYGSQTPREALDAATEKIDLLLTE